MSYILVVGNPIDGFSFYGPFPGDVDNDQAAVDWAPENIGTDWWVAELNPVTGGES